MVHLMIQTAKGVLLAKNGGGTITHTTCNLCSEPCLYRQTPGVLTTVVHSQLACRTSGVQLNAMDSAKQSFALLVCSVKQGKFASVTELIGHPSVNRGCGTADMGARQGMRQEQWAHPVAGQFQQQAAQQHILDTYVGS